jgi:hypothetical protein
MVGSPLDPQVTSKDIASFVLQNEGMGAPQSLLLSGLID